MYSRSFLFYNSHRQWPVPLKSRRASCVTASEESDSFLQHRARWLARSATRLSISHNLTFQFPSSAEFCRKKSNQLDKSRSRRWIWEKTTMGRPKGGLFYKQGYRRYSTPALHMADMGGADYMSIARKNGSSQSLYQDQKMPIKRN